MPEELMFATRHEFREWLMKNAATSGAVWLVFGKAGGPKTLSYQEALEEALCFGWVDSLMKSIDNTRYLRYLSPRRKGSKWSETNKTLVASLEARGLMTHQGRARVEEAKKNGQWDAPPPQQITDEQVASLTKALEGYEPAYTNYLAMSPSVKRTYTGLYFSAKSEQTRLKYLDKIIDRLNKNLKPM
jgi:uncharacterized protein YdeI (YjbR/CyaY-like superfamily)